MDHRADIYALGATLYELLTLRPAVAAAERAEILRQIAFDEPTPLRKHDKNIPAELETITLKCLAKTPTDRYATAREAAEDLRRWLVDKPIKARPPALIERRRRWSQRHVAAVTAAASSSIIAVSIGLVAVTIAQLRTRAYTDLARGKERTRAAANSAVAARTRKQRGKRAEDHLEVARRAVNEMYSEVAERWLEDESEMEGTQRTFLLKAVAFYEQLAEEPTADPAMRYESARAWHRAGRIHRKLGEAATAEQCLTRSLALLEQLTSECPSQSDYQWSLVSCEIQMGTLLDRARRFEEAESHLRQALDLIHRLGSPSPADGTYLHYLHLSKRLPIVLQTPASRWKPIPSMIGC